ncbi:MAG TPA: sodium-extruding oxaloacetate decarboxylase subunit alpha [Methanothrix sp.]|jgi:pyruvate carboxylase subunit B|nr:sodium-extruding oxaloacetate decarboxylase subunit alpha [Methanothrix sp.]HPC89249.1 sodium-extruding oxaloacetate decarboxylase subunit alpha [Methanothrix sp.]HQE86698.1 sodium-extruding oxaloacetate decarboxylase subunit alpha [Methanothrix sp.]HQI67228.1 sodium-extruding oxaloacetate decarboxylase subunit alpha [Methanothrix sp.]HRS84180.1 sodium-extruding oxaloacetate decarboxylase subunit alpha [Methanothrix sp.]
MGRVKLTDTVFRDAHQSLLATRMRTRDMLPIAEKMDQVGFFSLETWGGATFDSCIRYLNEDPWERLRALKKAMPNTPMQMLLRGQNLVGYRHYADDVVEKFVEKAAQNGVDIFRIFDAVNDIRNMERSIKAAKRMDKHVQGGISYTISPVHSNEQFAQFAVQLAEMGCDSICIKDMAGLITPKNAHDLIRAVKKEVSLPINLHTHCTSGMAQMSYFHACQAGVDILDVAISPLSGGSSQPATESLVASLQGTPYDTGLDLELLTEIKRYFEKIMEIYAPVFNPIAARVDTSVLVYQVPGGMLSNLVSQLIEQKAMDKYDEVLAEIPRVRKDLGYPPLVTPTSQIVGTQAVLNVITGDRYKMVPKEVKDYVKGLYGKPPAMIDPKVRLKVLCDEEPITVRPADLIPPEYENAKKAVDALGLARQEEDYLTYALYPQVALKFLQGTAVEEKLEKKQPAATAGAPLKAEPIALNVEIDGESYLVKVAPAGMTIQEAQPKAPTDGLTVPMQGVVIRYKAKKGDKVAVGDAVAVLEAMKMEQNIFANKSGTIKEIYIKEGTTVTPGDVLMSIE